MTDDTRLIELALMKAKAARKAFLAFLLEMALIEAREMVVRRQRGYSPVNA
ncbi:MAG: hypothetical protein ACT6QU_02305 [Aliihoeflea sp.]|uniref:hypothetical protein n=1 Tax=Aliihoeflea sp. TaxID=2608088 RepID=UPI004033D0E1